MEHSTPEVVPQRPYSLPVMPIEIPKLPPNDGHGTLEMLKIVRMLESQMPCCLVGTSALIFYGANRVRGEWVICVSTPLLETALSILRKEHKNGECSPFTEEPLPAQPDTLMHIFPLFKFDEYDLYFRVISSRSCHIECAEENIQRSSNGLPYPKLDVFMQSVVDMHDGVALCDAIDGTNVDESWGDQNLDLTGTNDIIWAQEQNDLLEKSQKPARLLWERLPTQVLPRREIWLPAINGKEHRLGWKYPKSIFATRFRLHGDVDPWLQDRDVA